VSSFFQQLEKEQENKKKKIQEEDNNDLNFDIDDLESLQNAKIDSKLLEKFIL
jgi:hypothetical protein